MPLVRHRRPRRDDHRGRGRGGPLTVEPGHVRTALERALEVARQGEAASPPDPAPRELAPYLTFQRLSGPALTAVRRVLDDHDDFRERVRSTTTAADVDAAGWLFLTRPAGWEALVLAAAGRADEDRGSEEAERRLRDLQRALEVADGKRAHAEAELARQREGEEAAHEELTAARREKRRLEDALQAHERRVEELEAKLADREHRLGEAQGAREAREHEQAETRRRLEEVEAELARRPPPLVPGRRPVDVDALRLATERLARASATLGRTVEAVLAEVPPEPVDLEAPTVEPRRTPTVLPGGVVADSIDGARWLLDRPAAVLLVDGYNVAMRAWPEVGIEDQRTRLVRALDDLLSRTGARAEVVFDGPAGATPTARQGTPTVGVRYSEGQLADDVVVDLVDAFPADRPVVVVSSDREVRDAARTRGANVVGSDTLVALFGG